jgi:hypothetical protein
MDFEGFVVSSKKADGAGGFRGKSLNCPNLSPSWIVDSKINYPGVQNHQK